MKHTLLFAPLALLVGCYHTAPDQGAPEPLIGEETKVSLPQPPPSEARLLHLALREEVDKTCHLKNPHFFYDEAQPRPQAHPELEKLAQCLQTDPYADLTILLVGRADPRGTDEYNRALGQRRAERVKQLLVEAGVDGKRILVSSAGESDAKGDQQDFSYGYDRRVDVVQIGFSHAPEHARPEELQQDYQRPREGG